MFIVLEGLPGAGKTTALRDLQNTGLSVIDEVVTVQPSNANEAFFIENDRRKYALVNQQADTVMDRNFVSTLCFNKCRDVCFSTNAYGAVLQKVNDMHNKGSVWHPDLYIFLTCSLKTSLVRQNASNDTLWSNTAFLKQVQLFYTDYFKNADVPYHVLDVDKTSRADVLQAILAIFKEQ